MPTSLRDAYLIDFSGFFVKTDLCIRYFERPITSYLTKFIMGSQERLIDELYVHAAKLGRAVSVDDVEELAYQACTHILGYGVGSLGTVQDEYLIFDGRTFQGQAFFPLDGPGIVTQAVRTREIQHIRDMRGNQEYQSPVPEDVWKCLSEVAIPIEYEGEVVAVLNVESEDLDAFSQFDVHILRSLALHVESAFYRILGRRGELDVMNRVNEAYRKGVVHTSKEIRNKMIIISQSAHARKDGLISDERFLTIVEDNSEKAHEILNKLVEPDGLLSNSPDP